MSALSEITDWLNTKRASHTADITLKEVADAMGRPLRNRDNGDDFIITSFGVFVCVDQQLKAMFAPSTSPGLATIASDVYEVRALISAMRSHSRRLQLV